MCIICRDFQLAKLNIQEARRNATEMVNTTKDKHEKSHLKELLEALDLMESLKEKEPKISYSTNAGKTYKTVKADND